MTNDVSTMMLVMKLFHGIGELVAKKPLHALFLLTTMEWLYFANKSDYTELIHIFRYLAGIT